ncbi:hypothetical protein ACIP5T_16420 [Microbacterium sp. NPDC088619]|uniref:hypothetical protein n=1 Tax=Microbacterium sp. NPDC088619 TaxID=3364196 RepID=UPI0038064027
MTTVETTATTSTALRVALRTAHSRSLADLGLNAIGRARFGWRDRSIGSVVERAGGRYWLRVVWSARGRARGAWWTGNQDASQIDGVAKPRLLDARAWEEGPLVYRAELMTLLPGRVCAPDAVLTGTPGLDESWWGELESSLDTLSAARTDRMVLDPEIIRRRISVFFGIEMDVDRDDWVASHGDLHWNNIHRDPFAIADWEAWGLAPRGYDAAFLLGHSLAVPHVAEQIARRFRRDLESEGGIVSQLYVMTKLLTRADAGEHEHLVPALHRHVGRLLGTRVPLVRASRTVTA